MVRCGESYNKTYNGNKIFYRVKCIIERSEARNPFILRRNEKFSVKRDFKRFSGNR